MIRIMTFILCSLFFISCKKDKVQDVPKESVTINENKRLDLVTNNTIYEYNIEQFGIGHDSLKIVFESPFKNEFARVDLDDKKIFEGKITTNQIFGVAGVVRTPKPQQNITIFIGNASRTINRNQLEEYNYIHISYNQVEVAKCPNIYR